MAGRSSDQKERYDGERSSAGADSDLNAAEETSDVMTFPEGGARAWVYQEYYETHQLQDQSSSSIAWIGSLQLFFLFGGSLVGGPLFDRFGAGSIWPASATYVFSIMMTSICKSHYQFLLAQGVLGGLALGFTMSPCMAATAQYFNKNRGAAMGISVAGSSLGGVIFPIALGKMLYNTELGFAWTIRICGFIILAILGISCSCIRARLPPRKGQFFLLSAFKEPPYLAIIGAGFLMLLGFFVPFFYLPTYAVSHGMSKDLATYLLSILNATSFFGRVIPGILADKVGRLNMLCAAGLSTGILILCWPRTSTNAAIIVFAALYGFFSGAIISLVMFCFASVPKDPKNIGTYMGMGMFVASFAALIGPPINGALLNNSTSFEHVSIFSGVLVLVGAFVSLLVKYVSDGGLFGKI